MANSSNNSQLQSLQQSSRLDFLYEASYSVLGQCPSLSRYYMNEFQNTLAEYELTLPKSVQRSACTSCGQITLPGLNTKVDIVTDDKLKKMKKKKNKIASVKKNKIQYTCLACQRSKVYNGSFKRILPSNSALKTVALKSTNDSHSVSKSQTTMVTKNTAIVTKTASATASQHTRRNATTMVKSSSTHTTATHMATVHNTHTSGIHKNKQVDTSNIPATTDAAIQKKKKNKGKKNSLKALLAKQQQQQQQNANQGNSLDDFLSLL
ncbi:RNAse P Rpr2/Rpp21/SNM1 subunit domain-containing protein [Mycotypha africana]|uniref:RNAse P Rpr2/Rpp21/SNM1 subunit domain-containing protein n=1 Tax=Mycotypha africana TaxID=64632 RepID=UPI0023015681|nr:RNAse P Rpr2/Rpp21/SNM1 subunit domain-containing protein [Mycotypha africana]KAI8982166.1 RNAse P Rpr2/Rpp21/SNM1 subunit domain-containing protein [Mycotypha africana]